MRRDGKKNPGSGRPWTSRFINAFLPASEPSFIPPLLLGRARSTHFFQAIVRAGYDPPTRVDAAFAFSSSLSFLFLSPPSVPLVKSRLLCRRVGNRLAQLLKRARRADLKPATQKSTRRCVSSLSFLAQFLGNRGALLPPQTPRRLESLSRENRAVEGGGHQELASLPTHQHDLVQTSRPSCVAFREASLPEASVVPSLMIPSDDLLDLESRSPQETCFYEKETTTRFRSREGTSMSTSFVSHLSKN